MIKKIAHCLALVALALQLGLFSFAGSLHAADTPAEPKPTPVEGQLQSEEFMFDLGGITNPAIKGGSQSSWIQKGVNYFIERGIAVMATLAGSVSVFMMVWGGFQMITSVGEDGYKHGVETIQNAAKGLAFVLCAYLLVVTVQLLINSING